MDMVKYRNYQQYALIALNHTWRVRYNAYRPICVCMDGYSEPLYHARTTYYGILML